VAIARDYELFRYRLESSYPAAFWYLEQVRRSYGCKDITEVFKYVYRNELNISLQKHFNFLNSFGEMHFNNKSRPIISTWMFLDPHRVKFPDVKLLAHDQVVLKNGSFLNPNHN
jgi:hypothetical protein